MEEDFYQGRGRGDTPSQPKSPLFNLKNPQNSPSTNQISTKTWSTKKNSQDYNLLVTSPKKKHMETCPVKSQPINPRHVFIETPHKYNEETP